MQEPTPGPTTGPGTEEPPDQESTTEAEPRPTTDPGTDERPAQEPPEEPGASADPVRDAWQRIRSWPTQLG